MVDPNDPPWIEHEARRFPLHLVDPTKNANRQRSDNLDEPHASRVEFDPSRALLNNKALGRKPSSTEEET